MHRLVTGRQLILGGVEIPHDKGLLGHSDADVLTHAIMDALLSSAAGAVVVLPPPQPVRISVMTIISARIHAIERFIFVPP